MASGPQNWMRTRCGDANVTPTSLQYPARRGQHGLRGGAMAKLIRCECGFVARGDSEEEGVGAIPGHRGSGHPALLETGRQDGLLAWIHAEWPRRIAS